MDITVISDAANTAARIESLTRIYDTPLLISDHTLESLGMSANSFSMRLIDEVMVKGKETSIKLIEILDALPENLKIKRLKLKESFHSAQQLYKRGAFAQAFEEFEYCSKNDPSDTVYHIYIDRCRRFIHEGTPQAWSGIWKFEHK